MQAGAFENCISLKSIAIPSTVTTIDSSISGNYVDLSIGTFRGCRSLENVELKNKYIGIGNSAFETCTALESVKINSSGKIGKSAFKNCVLINSVDMLLQM